MKILILVNYHKQHVSPCHLLCLPKTTLAQFRVHIEQIGDHPIVLVNCRQVNEVLKVDNIDVSYTFVHKNGRANQEQEVILQCTSLMVVNLHIIVRPQF